MVEGDEDDRTPDAAERLPADRHGDGDAPQPDTGSCNAETPTGSSGGSGGDGCSADFSGADMDFVGGLWGGGDALIGSIVGGVRIERFVAGGGMGRVYAGRQVKTGRPVALKLVRPEHASPRALRRFEFEAQVLGSLEHDGIVRVLHADTADINGKSQPFIVMEFVPQALRLDEYAAKSRLGEVGRLDERDWMEIFRDIASAVAAAHACGVIHRDLKPGNILVTTNERPRPRIIDFGVALVRDQALSTGQLTQDGTVGTPRYMSPEQALGGSEHIDVRSDVYSLGVVMYEMLAGRMPYEIKAPTNAAAVINNTPPEPLASVRPDVSRDVCTIVMKCLAKERSARYSTAAELAADIGRFLNDEALVAAPPSAYDTIRRFCRRHRAVAVSAASILATLLVALGVVSYFFLESVRRRDEMQVALRELEDERKLGDHLVDVVVRAIGGARPRSAAEARVRRDQLMRAADDVLAERSQVDPGREDAVKARFLRAIGDALMAIGRPQEARVQFQKAVELTASTAGVVSDDEIALALGCLAHAAFECGEFHEAIDVGLRAGATPTGAPSPTGEAAVSCRALALMSLDRLDEAATMYAAIEARLKPRLSDTDADLAALLTNHGEILRRRRKEDDLATAERKHREAVAIWDEQETHDDPREGVTLNNLGEVLRLTGRLEEAEACHQRALEVHRATLPPGHFLISTGLSKLAEVRRLSGRLAEAEALLTEALAIREAAGLADHPEAALLHWRLAFVFEETGREREAEEARRRCLDIRQARLGDEHRDTRAAAAACGLTAAEPGHDRSIEQDAGRLTLNQVHEESRP